MNEAVSIYCIAMALDMCWPRVSYHMDTVDCESSILSHGIEDSES